MKRLLWLDIAKGLAILWVVYFHFFRTYFEHGTIPPNDWSGLIAGTVTILRIVWLQISGLGFHAVGVFIILSGWALMESTARRAESGAVAWGVWYRTRFLASLSDVLGRAFGLLGFAFRRAPRTGGQPHRPQSARPALHRYHDELLCTSTRPGGTSPCSSNFI